MVSYQQHYQVKTTKIPEEHQNAGHLRLQLRTLLNFATWYGFYGHKKQ